MSTTHDRPTGPRRHRWLTVPSGGLLAACVFLPGYRDCGTNRTMAGNPLLVGICAFGVLVVVISFLLSRRRGERWVAIACIAGATACHLLLWFAWTIVEHAYAGLTLGLTASLSLAAGGLIWEREARGTLSTATTYLRVLAPLAIAGVAITALLSTWHPPPSKAYQIDFPFPVVH
jgi:hypothetical protein